MSRAGPQIILASSSPFRKQLLARLGIAFETVAPEVDETRRENETAEHLVRRLSAAKAQAIAADREALVIGSDQVATLGDTILGKPGSHARAREQLQQLSGQAVTFLTGLCLLHGGSGKMQLDVVPYRVYFRRLDDARIERYLLHDHPYYCAGSFKSEGLGITLFERMEGDDPTALVGLPLIRLTGMLAAAGRPLP
jgi:MAF protein